MKPLNKEILINYVEPTEQKSEGGLYIPPETNKLGGNARDYLRKGSVVAVNDAEEKVKVGDNVLFDYRARVIVPGMENHYLLGIQDVYMIVE